MYRQSSVKFKNTPETLIILFRRAPKLAFVPPPIPAGKIDLSTAPSAAESLDLYRICSLAHGDETTRRRGARRSQTELVSVDLAETSRLCSMLEKILVRAVVVRLSLSKILVNLLQVVKRDNTPPIP